jgi:hypothetical protein
MLHLEILALDGVRRAVLQERRRKNGLLKHIHASRLDAFGREKLPPTGHYTQHGIDQFLGLLAREAEDFTSRKQIVPAGCPAELSGVERQVSALLRHHWHGHNVIGRGKPPATARMEHGMVAWMVVVIGDHRVKDHPQKQFATVLVCLRRPTF